jgi:hypothetical protein
MLGQLLGGSAPSGPRPSRKTKRSRGALPGPATSAARNQSCWLDVWLGTTSTMIRMPSACASPTSASNVGRSPNSGSTARGSATS